MGLKIVKPVWVAALLALLLTVACAEGTTTIGPLSIDVPKGWQVTSRGGDNLQLANGTTGGATENEAGTAKAVFDVYLNSDVTADEYRKSLLKDNVGAKAEDIEIDDYDAVLLTYVGEAVAGRQEAVFVPRWRVRIVYRAAFPNDESAFFAGHSAFRAALESITFSDREPA